MLSAIKQSIQALRSNVTRTILTTLGIIIGIGTVIMVLSAGAGFRSLIDSQLEAFGTNSVFIQTRVPATTKDRASGANGGGENGRSGLVITTLKIRDVDMIKQLPNVSNAYGMVTGQAVASYRNNQKSAIYYGMSAERFEIDNHTLSAGRFFTSAEDLGGAPVVILGSRIATNLFNQDDPIGKLMRLGNMNFQVIGVYNSQGITGGGSADDSLYIPLTTAQKKMLGIDHLSLAVVELIDVNQSAATADNMRALLRRNHDITDPAKDDFSVQTQADAMGTFNTIFNGLTILLIAIAAISLIVGGVGIMNIMYVVVTERTAEIGLKKALGATNKDILNEFLIESIMVTILGGILGIILGALLGYLVAVVAGASGLTWKFSVPPYAVALGFGVSALIGISFGVLPARSASKMDPIEALRYE